MTYDGERKFTFRFVRGEKVKEFDFTVPMAIYREVFKEGPHTSPVTRSRSAAALAPRASHRKPGQGIQMAPRLQARPRWPRWRSLRGRRRRRLQGSESDWLKTLKGPPGPPGKDLRHLS